MTITPIPPIPTPPNPSGATAKTGTNFLQTLNNLQLQATTSANAVATGQSQNVATAIVAAEKAALALQLAAQVRTTALQAYQSIAQIP